MTRFITLIAAAAVAVAMLVSPASGAAPSGNKASCFDGASNPDIYGGNCTVLSPNKFFLNTSGGDLDGEYAGVSVEHAYAEGTPLAEIDKLSFRYEGTEPYGGAPRISLGVNEDGVGAGYDAFAYIEAAKCNDGDGLVDVINDPTCGVDYDNVTYASWSDFLAAYPDATVGYAPFIVADAPGEWTIWNVKLGAQSRGGK